MKETNQFQIFNHPQFGEVRTVIGNDGEPRFCLKDVCRALDIKQFRANERLGEDVISNHTLSTRGGNQQFMFINEARQSTCSQWFTYVKCKHRRGEGIQATLTKRHGDTQ